MTGAVEAIAAHPTNADIAVIATVNGGIWTTTNATTSTPTWTPRTDNLPSLSIGSIAYSPVDNNVLYAGTGSFSSGGGDGGPAIGVLKSTDGGVNWSQVGGSTLNNFRIRSVLPTTLSSGQVVLVAAQNGGGVFRSSNGGTSFTQISGSGGLPGGLSAFSVVADGAADPNIFYTSVGISAVGQGVFRSTDGGINWTNVSTGIGGLGGAAARIELAAHFDSSDGSRALYCAVIAQANGELSGVFRSTDRGNTWTAMDPVQTTESGGGVGLHPSGRPPGGQGTIHFSMLADRTNEFVVYVGGDRQPGPGEAGIVNFPNSIGAMNYSGRHFRGDASQSAGSQWYAINAVGIAANPNDGANGTSPHADSREMVWDANGNILEADDGGIYRLTNPNVVSRTWVSVNGNLRATEFYSVAYDSVNNFVFGGTQDVGSPRQMAAGGFTWTEPTFLQGDGAIAQVDDVTLPGNSIHYGSAQFLGNFVRQTFNSVGGIPDTVFPALLVQGTGQSLPNFDSTVQFIQPFAINAVAPTRLLFGTTVIYESTDQGALLTRPNGATNVGFVNAMAYGGKLSGASNPDVAWIGTSHATNKLLLRTTSGGPFNNLSAYTAAGGGSVLDIVLDPDNWQRAYVLDITNKVFRTTNAGVNWTNITNNLGSLSTDLRTIEFYSPTTSPDDEAIFVGGLGGVFATDNPQAGASTTWIEFGSGLPNYLVRDLRYYKGDDVLLVGGFGRGAWTVPNLSASVVAGDRFEPNDSFAAAANLGSIGDRTENNLTIHAANNDDYYRFTAAASGSLTVSLSFLNSQGNVDLFVYNAAQTQIGSSTTTNNSESVTVSITQGQTYYIKATGAGGATNPDYDMVLDGPSSSALGTTIFNFDGTNFTGALPSDSVGDIGTSHYIQASNGGGTTVTVYNKTTGAPVAGFTNISMSSLVSGASPGRGDPIVLFDQLANRWLLAEIGPNAISNPLSIFISNTADPTQGWTHYDVDTVNFPDYPKFGVWQDAYYVTSNESSTAVPVYALNRTKMLAGQALGANDVQRLTAPGLAGFGFQAFTPADNDGAAAPAGSPGYFMRHRDDEAHNPGTNNPTQDFLEVWRFTVDFTAPANSSFTQIATIAVAEFDSNLNGLFAFEAFPQPNNQKLDPLREVIMNRLQYRNFGAYEVLVGNLVTDVGDFNDHGGVRWFELRKVGAGAWTLFQEGTIAPDAHNRWMGAIAMDSAGDIALAYSITSPTVFPGLRYVGRIPGNSLGTMPDGEHVLVNGSSSQSGANAERWGDYFSMNVDPVDDRTFWFVGTYMPSGGQWRTRIGAFRFPDSTLPTVTGQTPTAGATISDSIVNMDVTFSEGVVGVDATDMVLGGTAAAGASVGTATNVSGYTWRFPISGLVNGALNISLAPDANDIEDFAGNDLSPRPTTWSYTVTDVTAPTVTGRTPTAGATIAVGSVNIDVTFSEAVFGVGATDMVLGGAAAGGASVGTVTNTSGNTWRFPVSGLTIGPLNISLAPNANDIEDAAGNDLTPRPTTWSYTVVDTTAPAASASAPDITTPSGGPQTITVTYTDNVAIRVSDIGGGDIQVTGPGGPLSAAFQSVNDNTDGTPRIATYTITPPGGSWDGGDNGTYTVSMMASQVGDTSGNTVPAGAIGSFIVNIDITPPTAPTVTGLSDDTGESNTDELTNDTTPTFSWTASTDSGGSGLAGYRWAVDNSTPEIGGTFTTLLTATPTVTANGPHVFYVRAVDGLGNFSNPVSQLAFNIDTVQPSVTTTTPVDGSVVGAGPTEILVNFSETMDINSNPSLTDMTLGGAGLGTANVTAVSWVDGDTARFTIGGAWGSGLVTVQLTTDFPRDRAGNALVDYTTGDFTIDTTPPTAPAVTGLSDDNGESNTDELTNDTTPTFTWTASTDSGGSTVAGYWWKVDDNSPEGDGTFTALLTATQTVTAGAHVFYVRAVDGVGNLGPVSQLAFNIDTVAPTVTGTTPADGSILNSGPSEILVNFSEAMDQSVLLPQHLTLGGAGRGSASVSGANWVDLDTARFTIGGTWGSGQVTVQLTGTSPRDVAGNAVAAYTTGDFTIDTILPTAPTVSGLTDDTGNSNSDELTSDTTPTFTWTASGDASGVAGYWWSVDDSTPQSGGTFTTLLTATPTVTANGAHVFYVRAQDNPGNLSSPVSQLAFTIDTVSPTVTSTTPADGSIQGGGPAEIVVNFSEAMDQSVGLQPQFLSLGGSGRGSASATGASWLDADTARFTIGGTWGNGPVTVQLTSGFPRDRAHNVLTSYTTGDFTIDATPPTAPTVTGLSDDTGQSNTDELTSDTTPTFTWTASTDSGGSGLAGYWWSVDDNTPESGGTFTTSLNATPTVSANGAHVFYVRAQDGVGNLSAVSQLAFNIDTAAPTVMSTTPLDGKIVANPPTEILVNFSEAMDGTSNPNLGDLTLGGAALGSANVTAASWVDADTARFTIGGSFSDGLVTVQLTSPGAPGLRDRAGNALVNYTIGDFTVERLGISSITGPAGSSTDTTPTFDWTPATNATGYQLYLADALSNATIFWEQNLTGTTHTPASALAAGNYKAWVRAAGRGGMGEWSQAALFSIITRPGTSVVTAPSGSISNVTPTFTWTQASNATSYELYILETTTNTRILWLRNHSSTTFTLTTALSIGSYKAWVRATGPGGVGDWSQPTLFTVTDVPRPGVSTVTAPTGSTTDTTPTFAWTAASNATSYELYILEPASNTRILWLRNHTSTTFTLTTPLTPGSYKAWVRATGPGGVGNWSQPTSFTITVTGPKPGTSTLTSPGAPGSIGDTTPTFNWTQASDATSYDLYLADSNSNTVFWLENLQGTTHTPTTALALGSYTAWVRAKGPGGVGDFSQGVSFSIVGRPGTSTITAPTGTISNATPTFTWTAASNATSYELYILETTTNTRILWLRNHTSTTFTLTTPLAAGSYKAWVRATGPGGVGDWSLPVTFTVTL